MRAFCLASGPSLTAADAWAVRGRGLVLAVNTTYHLAPWADILYAADQKWWDWEEGAPTFRGRKYGAMPAIARRWPDVTILMPTGEHGFDPRPGTVRTGANSGYQALHLAVQLGATQVVLLGYDMQPADDGTHHHHGLHPDYRYPNYARGLRAFASIVAPLAERGVDVVNCSRHTALTVFRRAPLAEVLAT